MKTIFRVMTYKDLSFDLEIHDANTFFLNPQFLQELIYDSTTQPKKWHRDFMDEIQDFVEEAIREEA